MTQAITQVKEARKRAASIRRKAMTDPVANPCCSACGFSYPPVMQGHHVHPIAESEIISDEIVWLCPNCHALVHEIRRVYYSAKRVNNLRMKVSHLDYWLYEVCPQPVMEKLISIAKRTNK